MTHPPARLRPSAALALLLGLLAAPATAQTALAEAYPADVSSPEAVIEALYETVNREPGQPWQSERSISLFLPDAVLVANSEQRAGPYVSQSPEEFWGMIVGPGEIGGPADRGFVEEEISRVIHQYGDIAQAFSSYRKRFADTDEILGRGINSIQLVRNDGRWWIASMAWDEEVGAGPIPTEYGVGAAGW